MIVSVLWDALGASTSLVPLSSLDALTNSPQSNGGWATIIGIVTAICGNILISVALNTQRYAHIRLHEQWVAKQRKRQTLLRQSLHRVYGATQNGKTAIIQNGGDKSTKGVRM